MFWWNLSIIINRKKAVANQALIKYIIIGSWSYSKNKNNKLDQINLGITWIIKLYTSTTYKKWLVRWGRARTARSIRVAASKARGKNIHTSCRGTVKNGNLSYKMGAREPCARRDAVMVTSKAPRVTFDQYFGWKLIEIIYIYMF